MTSSGDDYDELWEAEWFEIPNVSYIVKFKFEEDSYIILVTNLKEIYGEKLTATEANERFNILNPHAEMKPLVLMKSIKASCEAFLRRDTYDQRCFQQCTVLSQVITMHLAFIVSEVVVTFEIKPQILPSENLRTHLIASTVFQTSLLCRASDKKTGYGRIQSLDMCDSSLQQKSKMSEKELVKTFITIQRTVQDCILANYSCDNTYRKTTEIKASSERRGKNVSQNVPQLSEMSATLVKREIEGSLNAKNNPSSTADNNPSSTADNNPSSKAENPLSLKVENDPSLKAENDSGLSEMQSKQKKRKFLKF